MSSTSLRTLAAIAVVPLALARHAGGWAVVSTEELPDHLVAGRAAVISFAVRQHGVTLLDGLSPRLEATAPGASPVVADATPAGEGRYRASLVVPREGAWTVTIHGGFRESRTVLLPIRAVGPRDPLPAAPTPAQRGRALFAGKGCVTCHVHGDVDRQRTVPIGPELTGRRYPAEYLARFLARPDTVPPRVAGQRMPNLGLSRPEIAALVAFINGDAQVTAR